MLIGCDRAINCQGERYGGDLSKLTLLYLRLSGLSSCSFAAVYRSAHLRLYALIYRLWQVVGGRFTARAKNSEKEQVKNQSKSNKKSFSRQKNFYYCTSTSNVASGDTKEPLKKRGENPCGPRGVGGAGVRAPGIGGRWGPGGPRVPGSQGSKGKSHQCNPGVLCGWLWTLGAA